MRTKDDPEVFNPTCGCGRPITEVYYHRQCNLVFCGFCIGKHECKPVNGPICQDDRTGQPVLLPAAPYDGERGVRPTHLNGTSKNHVKKWKKKR